MPVNVTLSEDFQALENVEMKLPGDYKLTRGEK
jgi:hypothetical protein